MIRFPFFKKSESEAKSFDVVGVPILSVFHENTFQFQDTCFNEKVLLQDSNGPLWIPTNKIGRVSMPISERGRLIFGCGQSSLSGLKVEQSRRLLEATTFTW
jgi:hypothetical protein